MALPEAALGRGMKLPGAAAKPSCLLVIRHEPHDQCAGACVHIEKRHQGGLEILLAAHDYAADLDRDVWDFAVEIDELRRAGLHNADIRWLVHKGLLEHAHERVAGTGDGREFRQDCRLLLRRRSCFVLTEMSA